MHRPCSTFVLPTLTALFISIVPAGAGSAANQTLRFAHHPGYARIAFEWPEGVNFTQSKQGDQLILTVDRSVSADLSAAVRTLSTYLASAQTSTDARQIRFLVKTGVIANAWQADRTTIVVDFATGATGTAAVTARVGQHDGFYRIVLDWHDPIDFTSSQTGSTLAIRFGRSAAIDTELLRQNLPGSVKAVTTGSAHDRSWLELQLMDGASADVSSYGDRARVVIDVRTARPGPHRMPPAADPQAAAAAALAALELNRAPMTPTALPDAPGVMADLGRWFDQVLAALPDAQLIIDHCVHLLDRIKAILLGAFEPTDDGPGLFPPVIFGVGAVDRSTADEEALIPGAILGAAAGRRRLEAGGPDLAISRTLGSLSDSPGLFATSAGGTGGSGRRASERAPVRSDVLESITAGQAAPDGQVSTPPAEAPPGASQESSAEDQDALDPELRALNRVLVEAGGLLLPPWGVEIAPEILYEHSGSFGLLVIDGADGQTAMAQQVRRDGLELATTLRVGLPWDSQAEVRVPYEFNWQEESVTGQENNQRDGHGLGDIAVGLSHQFLREGQWWPDVLGEVRWKTDTGDDNFEVGSNGMANGTGFNAISGALTAVKSYDPLVFFGKFGYTANLADKKEGVNIDPGDSFQVSLGTVLATGPGTSLRFGISQSFVGDAKVEGDTVQGTDQVIGLLSFGAAAALPNRVLMDISAGVGITEDAPDFTLRASLPYRF